MAIGGRAGKRFSNKMIKIVLLHREIIIYRCPAVLTFPVKDGILGPKKGGMPVKTQTIVLCALFAALMAVCAWISVPLGPIAVTMQTLGLFLTLGILGGRRGVAVMTGYLALGAIGLPVFSGFRGGIGMLLGPTGGFVWGFILTALLYPCLQRRLPEWIAMALSLLGCYACGTVWFALRYGGSAPAILAACVLPYLIPDALKLLLARQLTRRLKHFLRE